jgi:hypothetical protein
MSAVVVRRKVVAGVQSVAALASALALAALALFANDLAAAALAA